MILFEDYFKDIEISDDDIDVDKTDESLSGNEFIEYCQKRYSHTICIKMSNKTDMNITALADIIDNLKKYLEYLFNIFNIEHSDIFGADDTAEIQSNSGKLNIFMLNNNIKFISAIDDIDSETYRYYYLFLVVYVNFPEFNTKTAVRFVKSLITTTYKHQYNMVNNIKITDKAIHPSLYRHNPEDCMLVLQKKVYKDYKQNGIYSKWVKWNTIEYFFGE